jgi:hypothetical protein
MEIVRVQPAAANSTPTAAINPYRPAAFIRIADTLLPVFD